jgi:hypothetical protein
MNAIGSAGRTLSIERMSEPMKHGHVGRSRDGEESLDSPGSSQKGMAQPQLVPATPFPRGLAGGARLNPLSTDDAITQAGTGNMINIRAPSASVTHFMLQNGDERNLQRNTAVNL